MTKEVWHDWDMMDMSEFLFWLAENCTIEDGFSPYTGDYCGQVFHYKGEQQDNTRLIDIYNEVKDN